MSKWGIDISRWQKGLNLSDTTANFVIIKAGGSDDGIYIDSCFNDFYNQAKNAGIPCGLYWYTKALSVYNLRAEIDYLFEHIKGMQFELPIFLDLEESVLYEFAPYLAKEWITNVAERGYYPAIYASYSWWEGTLKEIKSSMTNEQIWLALWMDCDSPDYPCGIWQNGITTVNGIQVDSDWIYCDYSFIKDKGLNGFSKMDNRFKDVTPDDVYYKAVEWLADQGAVVGYKDGTFHPNEPLTRAQLAMILYRLYNK